jgi:hypothetical protein
MMNFSSDSEKSRSASYTDVHIHHGRCDGARECYRE